MSFVLLISLSIAYGQTTQLEWAYNISAPRNDHGSRITIDISGNVIITGHFRDTVDLDPGPGVDLSLIHI